MRSRGAHVSSCYHTHRHTAAYHHTPHLLGARVLKRKHVARVEAQRRLAAGGDVKPEGLEAERDGQVARLSRPRSCCFGATSLLLPGARERVDARLQDVGHLVAHLPGLVDQHAHDVAERHDRQVERVVCSFGVAQRRREHRARHLHARRINRVLCARTAAVAAAEAIGGAFLWFAIERVWRSGGGLLSVLWGNARASTPHLTRVRQHELPTLKSCSLNAEARGASAISSAATAASSADRAMGGGREEGRDAPLRCFTALHARIKASASAPRRLQAMQGA